MAVAVPEKPTRRSKKLDIQSTRQNSWSSCFLVWKNEGKENKMREGVGGERKEEGEGGKNVAWECGRGSEDEEKL